MTRFATIASGLLLACARPQVRDIPLDLTWHGKPVTCGLDGLALDDLRFFLSDVQLTDDAGRPVPASFVADGQWQTERVALVDLSVCATDRARRPLVRIQFRGEPRTMRFTLGVPFDLNHANPSIAEGPLAIGAMSWGWQAGYKFLRLEGQLNGAPFRVHLGSTECEGTFGHITSCKRPNRGVIELPFPATAINLELSELIDSAVLAAPKGCMGDPDAACAKPYAALGLDLDSGLPRGAQRAFLAH